MSESARTDTRMKKISRRLVGIVDRAAMSKTRRVKIDYLMKHEKYGKYIRRRTIVAVHDENDESRLGDTVEIVPCRPMSKTKAWKLVRVVEKAPENA